MRTLVNKADIITPNFTEAAFLLDEPFREGVFLERVLPNLNVPVTASSYEILD